MTTDELERMASRGEEDGHDRKWFTAVTRDRKQIDRMIKAADAAKKALEAEQPEYL